MRDSEEVGLQVLRHLEQLTNKIVITENLHSELSQFRLEHNEKIGDLKESLKEVRADVKELHQQYDVIDRTLVEFKGEMKPIIDFKQQVQQQIIKYSTVAFAALILTTMGLNQAGIS